MENQLIDHLFRYHSGKMVSVLTRIFGLSNLEIVEDAVQDTFIKASMSWRKQVPENPEAWLTQAAKNRILDIFRKLKTEKNYLPNFYQGANTIAINELFLESEIEDAQLRMIFTACHPKLNAKDRIAFALKTVSGFSSKEIASALLTKEETVKKRLVRARKVIQKENLTFQIPQGKALKKRLESVLEVLYLIFNEGFHSNKKEQLIQEELCGEAMRLCKMLLKNIHTRTSESYALFALMCFHAARLESKTNAQNQILDLEHQDRSLWHYPLIELGNSMMYKAVENNEFSCYHYEAAIASEHLKAKTFNATNWDKILYWYKCLNSLQPMANHLLTMAVICIQKNDLQKADTYLSKLNANDFEQRKYLFYGTKSDFYAAKKNLKKAITHINLAIESVNNQLEKEHLIKKKIKLHQN
ncbi:sigma factor, ECF subfamily protein [Polaribacter reichenbachii]|uniref:Sigma factor, ECF subfamily protein n=1 Tax=Polaribacter reichenbachii TaxID=996801 RepID=A0A1B8U3F5_9FLAO|nr:sigma-70 family RNA polymerase sigma factor [Polaribacter reichenbachii]APZ46581.1 sigma factor, ECF subfamily protein [Polaribacter reichenbachii]AUC17227.1 sigma factor, ECF subfamily protein [Polaribacter reichenbachii]OBY66405.1 sigma factor, ECF subfamily protein [Polaribacter reichenbachii]